jgi:hypothetical protein
MDSASGARKANKNEEKPDVNDNMLECCGAGVSALNISSDDNKEDVTTYSPDFWTKEVDKLTRTDNGKSPDRRTNGDQLPILIKDRYKCF